MIAWSIPAFGSCVVKNISRSFAETSLLKTTKPPDTVATASKPTRTRYWVIVFAVTLAIIQYIDRVCISQAATLISRDLKLSEQQMGWVFSAFTLAYALFEIPAGYLGDRIGRAVCCCGS